jgi:hypothetical protein
MENKMSDKLIESINEIANLADSDKTNIKGKLYTTVNTRLQTFRKHFGVDANIKTKILHNDLERVVVEATVSIYKDGSWRDIGNDCAEEFRAQGMVNKTSALENCSTSAIGRALSACGLGGSEYASAFEMDNAINNKQPAPDLKESLVLKNAKGHPYATFPDTHAFIGGLRKVLGNPEDQECIDVFKANSSEIERIYNDLPENDRDLQAFEKLIDIYSKKVV